jgi:hypothetical protein
MVGFESESPDPEADAKSTAHSHHQGPVFKTIFRAYRKVRAYVAKIRAKLSWHQGEVGALPVSKNWASFESGP